VRLTGIFIYWSILLTLSVSTVSAQVVHIKDPTLAQYVISFDWLSLGVAALIALTGGAGRTATSLFRVDDDVKSAVQETIKDAFVALFTGALCFVLIGIYSALLSPPPLAIQAGFIFIAGFARGTLINRLDDGFGKILDASVDGVSGWVRGRTGSATSVASPVDKERAYKGDER